MERKEKLKPNVFAPHNMNEKIIFLDSILYCLDFVLLFIFTLSLFASFQCFIFLEFMLFLEGFDLVVNNICPPPPIAH